MSWFKQARESFKKDDPQEILPKEVTQTFGEILKSEGIIEALNTFADRYNDTLFSGPKIPILKKEAFAIGIIAACAVATQIPGMENPIEGAKHAMDATVLLLAQQGEIPKETFLKIREGLLPFLQALAIIPGNIFLAGLVLHAKDTYKDLTKKDDAMGLVYKNPASKMEEGQEPS